VDDWVTMSAIGRCIRMKRADFARALDLATAIHTETTGRGLWKKTVTVGVDEFDRVWDAAVLDERDFEYSGYVLSNYFIAQEVINGLAESPFDSPEGQLLARVFTAAFAVTAPITFPPLPDQTLRQFCKEEYGEEDAPGMCEAITAAHRFYSEASATLQSDETVVFLIS